MSDLQLLTVVRSHLLNQQVTQHVHLALPPKANYPLILIELEEVWSSYPLPNTQQMKSIQTRLKFKVGIYSQSPGLEEAALLSDKTRKALEGVTVLLPSESMGDRSATLRFLACVTEVQGNGLSSPRSRTIHHFYDSVIRG